ncbi:MAG: hypothetical protein ACJ72N_03215 [Labedaea sp.]
MVGTAEESRTVVAAVDGTAPADGAGTWLPSLRRDLLAVAVLAAFDRLLGTLLTPGSAAASTAPPRGPHPAGRSAEATSHAAGLPAMSPD